MIVLLLMKLHTTTTNNFSTTTFVITTTNNVTVQRCIKKQVSMIAGMVSTIKSQCHTKHQPRAINTNKRAGKATGKQELSIKYVSKEATADIFKLIVQANWHYQKMVYQRRHLLLKSQN